MKAVILSGCTKKNGKTIKVVNEFIRGLEESGCEVTFIDSVKNKVQPCTGCLVCEKTGHCSIKGDMDKVYEHIINADIVALASPIYFASITAQLKAMIDRCQTLYSRRYILKQQDYKPKKGYLIFTAGLKNTKQVECMELLSKFFMLSCNGKLQKSIYALNTDDSEISDDVLIEAYESGRKATL